MNHTSTAIGESSSGCFLLYSAGIGEKIEMGILIGIASIIGVTALLMQGYFVIKFFSAENKSMRKKLKKSFQGLLLSCTTLYLIETLVRPFMLYFYWTCNWEMFYAGGSTASPSKLFGNILLLLLFVLRLTNSVKGSLFQIDPLIVYALILMVITFVLMIFTEQIIWYINLDYDTVIYIFDRLWISHNILYMVVTIFVLVLFIRKFYQLMRLFKQKPQTFDYLLNIVTKVEC